MRRNSVKLSRRHKVWLYSITALLYVTGIVWAWLHYLAATPNEFTATSPAEPWMLKLHGAGAMAIMVVLGTLLPTHVRIAWQTRRNRTNGIALIVFFALLSASGYGLYYFGDERARSWTSWAHLWVGIALPAIIIFHIWTGRRSALPKKPRG